MNENNYDSSNDVSFLITDTVTSYFSEERIVMNYFHKITLPTLCKYNKIVEIFSISTSCRNTIHILYKITRKQHAI